VIRIHKPETPPERLAVEGKKKRRSHCTSYSRNPSVYETGTKKFEFDSSIYAHKTVKQALIKAQHQKCCFCERLIGTDGDVEHFRPKQAYKQATGEALQYPAYYWLAYEWENLYLACTGCNQRHKQNLFPLQNPDERATNHKQSIEQEKPIFIDFGKENPEEFIGFRGEVAYAISGNQRGQVTIDSLKLNNIDRTLLEQRLEHLADLKILSNLLDIAASQPENLELQDLAKKAKDRLESAIFDKAEFTAANRCAIASKFQYVIG
jgi:uncharacterized protein (TIGR02646 family)